MRYDLHMHTNYSRHWFFGIDALGTPEEMVRAAIRKGLDGIAITDHDNVKGGLKAKSAARRIDKGFKVITGAEISSRAGHILGLGIKENVRPDLSVEETVEKIHELGGVAVAAHPFARFWFRACLQEEAIKADALEALNACTCRRFQNNKAAWLAKKSGVPGIASSDSHCTRTVGLAGITCDTDPLTAIRKNRFKTFGEIAKKRDFLTGKKYGRSIKWRFGGGPNLEQ
ncbi:MAG: PHP domain-containing protein [Candidatus Aenigmatarchaeota archaeon]